MLLMARGSGGMGQIVWQANRLYHPSCSPRSVPASLSQEADTGSVARLQQTGTRLVSDVSHGQLSSSSVVFARHAHV